MCELCASCASLHRYTGLTTRLAPATPRLVPVPMGRHKEYVFSKDVFSALVFATATAAPAAATRPGGGQGDSVANKRRA